MADLETFFEQVPLSDLKQAGLLPGAPHIAAAGNSTASVVLRADATGPEDPSALPHRFDVFRAERDGAVLWHGTAESLEQAKTLVEELAAASPGEYLILDQKSGAKFAINRKACEGV